jgi:hypothetical protein
LRGWFGSHPVQRKGEGGGVKSLKKNFFLRRGLKGAEEMMMQRTDEGV